MRLKENAPCAYAKWRKFAGNLRIMYHSDILPHVFDWNLWYGDAVWANFSIPTYLIKTFETRPDHLKRFDENRTGIRCQFRNSEMTNRSPYTRFTPRLDRIEREENDWIVCHIIFFFAHSSEMDDVGAEWILWTNFNYVGVGAWRPLIDNTVRVCSVQLSIFVAHKICILFVPVSQI